MQQWAGAGHEGQQSCWRASLGGPVLSGTACGVPYSAGIARQYLPCSSRPETPSGPPTAVQAHAGGQAERAACDSNGLDVCQRAGQVFGHWSGDVATPGRACPPLQPQGGVFTQLAPGLPNSGSPATSSKAPQGCASPSSTNQQADIQVPTAAQLQLCGPDACLKVCKGRMQLPGSEWCTSTTGLCGNLPSQNPAGPD